MILVFGILALLMTIVFIAVNMKAGRVVAVEIVYAHAWNNKFEAERLESEIIDLTKQNEKYHKLSDKVLNKKVRAKEKKIKQYLEVSEKYLAGKRFTFSDALIMFGYELMVLLGIDIKNSLYRKIVSDCEQSGFIDIEKEMETDGKKNASIYAHFILGEIISFSYAGIVLGSLVSALMSITGRETRMALLIGVSIVGVGFILGYLPYDTISATARKRREEFETEFPNTLSKITLLTVAGLNISKAVEQTTKGAVGIVGKELRIVLSETDHGQTIEKAFIRMQNRCKNPYLDKFVALITKSYVAGNANLAENLMAINNECWLEKKHSVRRMSETIQNKLFVPTMLMFIGILIVIIVPAMSSLNVF